MTERFAVQSRYDDEGDVLYISFGEPQPADDADVTEEGIIVRTRKGKIVGLTVLDASQAIAPEAAADD